MLQHKRKDVRSLGMRLPATAQIKNDVLLGTVAPEGSEDWCSPCVPQAMQDFTALYSVRLTRTSIASPNPMVHKLDPGL